MTQSLVLIKPDAFERMLFGWCLSCFEHFGIEDLRMERITEAFCDLHYAEHREKGFYLGLREFMCSGPLVPMIVNGNVEDVRERAKLIRRKFECVGGPRNLVHSSDSIESAHRELDLWFPNRRLK